MSILYINPLPKEIHFIVLSEKNESIFELSKEKNGDEFSFFPEVLTNIVSEYDVQEIWSVIGPGPFTLMRIVTLSINSVSYAKSIRLKGCHFFELISPENIPLIEANTREYLVGNIDEMKHVEKSLLPSGRYEGIFSEIDFTDDKTFVEYRENLPQILEVFGNKDSTERIAPIYYKPPRITG